MDISDQNCGSVQPSDSAKRMKPPLFTALRLTWVGLYWLGVNSFCSSAAVICLSLPSLCVFQTQWRSNYLFLLLPLSLTLTSHKISFTAMLLSAHIMTPAHFFLKYMHTHSFYIIKMHLMFYLKSNFNSDLLLNLMFNYICPIDCVNKPVFTVTQTFFNLDLCV